MGYVNETEMVEWFGPEDGQYSGGSWSDDQSSGLWRKRRAASSGTAYIKLSLKLPGNGSYRRGCRLKQVVVHLRHVSVAPTALSAELLRVSLPAVTGDAPAPVSVPFAYDSDHSTPAERVTVAEHRLALVLDESAWVQAQEAYQVVLTLEASSSSVFYLYGAQAYYTLRL